MDQILTFLAVRGMGHMRDLCAYTGRHYTQVGDCVRDLRRNGRVIVVGTAWDAGRDDVRRQAPMYALKGTPTLKKRPYVAPLSGKRSARRSRGAGSGQIAAPITIPQFRWGGTRLW